jgi:phosphate transport system substrate-binding protein
MKQHILCMTLALGTLVSCQNNNKEEKVNTSILENVNKGVFKVYAEENTAYLMEQIIEVYTGRFPEATIDIRYTEEWDVIDKMVDDSARIIVLQRELNEEELDYIRRAFDTKPIQSTFAYDAIALVRDRGAEEKVIPYEQFLSWMQKGDNRFVTLAEYLDIYKLLIRMTGVEGKEPALEIVKSVDDLKIYLAANPDKVGLLPFFLVSDQDDPKAKEIASKFSWLGFEVEKDTVFPSQSSIFTKEWPLIKSYTFISCKISRTQGFGFVNFVHTIPMKKLIVKAGLIPYRMPERAVVIKAQEF